MKIIAVIPARYASTRFPAKLMQDLGGKTVILKTYEAAVNTNLFQDVFVVTDSDFIFNEIVSHGGKAIMSIKEHESGSDRIAEAIANLDVDVVVNVQGDEPFINAEPLKEVIEVFKQDVGKKVDLASLMREISNKVDINNLEPLADDKEIGMNNIGRVKIKTSKPVMVDSYKRNRGTGSLILVDSFSFETVGAGMILEN